MNKTQALAQRCSCGQYPIGVWYGNAEEGGKASVSTVQTFVPLHEAHTLDRCAVDIPTTIREGARAR